MDQDDWGDGVRALFYLEHSIRDGRTDSSGEPRTVSRRMQFVEIAADGAPRAAGSAPYLDYRPIREAERNLVGPALEAGWLTRDLESTAFAHAVSEIVPAHAAEVRRRKEELVTKTMAAVKDRLTKEIVHWDNRAQQLKAQEDAGRESARLNSAKAQQRTDALEARLSRRLSELERERQLIVAPPVVIGGALVVPAGLLAVISEGPAAVERARATARVERTAMEAVFAAERGLGFEPRDVSREEEVWDIESHGASVRSVGYRRCAMTGLDSENQAGSRPYHTGSERS